MDEGGVKLFCSAGRGTEKFVEKELIALPSTELDVKVKRVMDGKVFFSINRSEEIQNLLKLKTVERIFLELNVFKTSRLPYGKGKGQFVNALKRRLVKENRFLKTADIFQNINHHGNDSISNKDVPAAKKLKLEKSEGENKSFRVSCKISGHFSKLASAQELNIELGKYISKLTGWNIDLKRPLFEISVHINDEMIVAGIPVSREPLSKRDYILHSGLRSPITWILAYLTQIQPGDIVLDPMCGKSTILIEAVKSVQPNAVYFGLDRNYQQLKTAQSNVHYAGFQNNILLLLSNGLDLPFQSRSMDKVICDAPFGEKHKTEGNIHQFYDKLLQEIYRVLRPGGRLVLLTSSRLHPKVISYLKSSPEHTEASGHFQSTNEDELPDVSEENVKVPQFSSEHCVMPEHDHSMSDIAEDKMDATINCEIDSVKTSSGQFQVADNKMDATNVGEKWNVNSVCDDPGITFIKLKNKPKTFEEGCKNVISKCDMKSVIPVCDKVINKCDRVATTVCDIDVTKKCDVDLKDAMSLMNDFNKHNDKTGKEGQNFKQENKLLFKEDHYMKLGETHAYIIVAEKGEI